MYRSAKIDRDATDVVVTSEAASCASLDTHALDRFSSNMRESTATLLHMKSYSLTVQCVQCAGIRLRPCPTQTSSVVALTNNERLGAGD